jgi:hypothetical protein
MRRLVRTVPILGIALVFAACGGSDVPTGPDPQGASFSQDVNPILVGGCSAGSCHGGGVGGLTLTASAATNYANLVGVQASSAPAFQLVNPNNATDSYVVMKLEGRQLSGSQMPLGGALSAAQITTIRSWIDDGAQNN